MRQGDCNRMLSDASRRSRVLIAVPSIEERGAGEGHGKEKKMRRGAWSRSNCSSNRRGPAAGQSCDL